MDNPLPNAVIVMATVILGGVTFTSQLMVQTHKLEEIELALEAAWKQTRKQALTPMKLLEE